MALRVAKVSLPHGALAGGVAATASLAVGELVSGALSRVPSPVTAIGQWVINAAPQPAVETGINTFGRSDKPALVVGITAIAIVLGALLGLVAIRRQWIIPVGFGVFGLLGVIATARLEDTNVAGAVVTAIVSVAAGAFVYRLLLRPPAPAPARPAKNTKVVGGGASRRSFLLLSGAALAGAAVVAELGRALHERVNAAAARAGVTLPPPAHPAPVAGPSTAFTDVPGLSPLFTPNADFYRIDTALVVPVVDLASWRLSMSGMVDHPFELTFDELLAMPMDEVDVTLQCVSNDVGGDLVGNAAWLGVPLRSLLVRAGVQPGASQLVGRSVDNFTVGFPTAILQDSRDAIVAVGMNGEPLPAEHGFPARLIVAGLYGYVSATKWLTQIELTTLDAYDAYWIERGWAKEGPIKTQSRIDVPRSTQSDLKPGPIVVAGVAWAPTRGIRRVELQVDQAPWVEAELTMPLSDETWRQWRTTWNATPGIHVLRVRATDGTGQVQTATLAPPEPDGATGYHTIEVRVGA